MTELPYEVAKTKSGCLIQVIPSDIVDEVPGFDRETPFVERWGDGNLLVLSVPNADPARRLPQRVEVYLDDEAAAALVEALT